MANEITAPITVIQNSITAPVSVVVNEIVAPITIGSKDEVTAPITISPKNEIVATVSVVKNEIIAPITIGSKGDKGDPGEDGGVTSKEAGEILGGHRVLATDSAGKLVHANIPNATHRFKLVGISTQSAVVGAQCVYADNGKEIIEPTWAWALDLPIYLTGAGLLTQTPPTIGFIAIVAFPLTATSLSVRLSNPITLGV
jgi:hypothetical protein